MLDRYCCPIVSATCLALWLRWCLLASLSYWPTRRRRWSRRCRRTPASCVHIPPTRSACCRANGTTWRRRTRSSRSSTSARRPSRSSAGWWRWNPEAMPDRTFRPLRPTSSAVESRPTRSSRCCCRRRRRTRENRRLLEDRTTPGVRRSTRTGRWAPIRSRASLTSSGCLRSRSRWMVSRPRLPSPAMSPSATRSGRWPVLRAAVHAATTTVRRYSPAKATSTRFPMSRTRASRNTASGFSRAAEVRRVCSSASRRARSWPTSTVRRRPPPRRMPRKMLPDRLRRRGRRISVIIRRTWTWCRRLVGLSIRCRSPPWPPAAASCFRAASSSVTCSRRATTSPCRRRRPVPTRTGPWPAFRRSRRCFRGSVAAAAERCRRRPGRTPSSTRRTSRRCGPSASRLSNASRPWIRPGTARTEGALSRWAAERSPATATDRKTILWRRKCDVRAATRGTAARRECASTRVPTTPGTSPYSTRVPSVERRSPTDTTWWSTYVASTTAGNRRSGTPVARAVCASRNRIYSDFTSAKPIYPRKWILT